MLPDWAQHGHVVISRASSILFCSANCYQYRHVEGGFGDLEPLKFLDESHVKHIIITWVTLLVLPTCSDGYPTLFVWVLYCWRKLYTVTGITRPNEDWSSPYLLLSCSLRRVVSQLPSSLHDSDKTTFWNIFGYIILYVVQFHWL